MELNNHVLLIISSLILSIFFSAEARNISPSSSAIPTPVSDISSSPSSAPASSPSNLVVDKQEDIPVALEKFITSGISKADEGIKVAESLLEDETTPSAIRVCLKQCVENLGYAIDDFKKALDDVLANDFYLLSEDLAAAASDVAGCDRCFEEVVGGNNPVVEFDQAVKFTSTHCQSILDYTS